MGDNELNGKGGCTRQPLHPIPDALLPLGHGFFQVDSKELSINYSSLHAVLQCLYTSDRIVVTWQVNKIFKKKKISTQGQI